MKFHQLSTRPSEGDRQRAKAAQRQPAALRLQVRAEMGVAMANRFTPKQHLIVGYRGWAQQAQAKRASRRHWGYR